MLKIGSKWVHKSNGRKAVIVEVMEGPDCLMVRFETDDGLKQRLAPIFCSQYVEAPDAPPPPPPAAFHESTIKELPPRGPALEGRSPLSEGGGASAPMIPTKPPNATLKARSAKPSKPRSK